MQPGNPFATAPLLQVGDIVQICHPATLRAKEDLASDVIAELEPKSLVFINALGRHDRRRAEVFSSERGGWISLWTTNGDCLVDEVTLVLHDKEDWVICRVLTSASVGELQRIRDICEPPFPRSRWPNLNAGNEEGNTALMYASAFGHLDTVKYLATHPRVEVNMLDIHGRTALVYAIKLAPGNVLRIVQELLEAHAFPDARDDRGRCCLSLAVEKKYEDVCRLLLDHLADPSGMSDRTGLKPLDLALKLEAPATSQLARISSLLRNAGAIRGSEASMFGEFKEAKRAEVLTFTDVQLKGNGNAAEGVPKVLMLAVKCRTLEGKETISFEV